VGADSKLYRIGVTPDCPVHQVTVGGQTFPRRSEIVSGFGAETKRNEIMGAIVLMTPTDLKKIKERAKTKVIRATKGKRARAKVYSTEARNYSANPGDLPVSQFLYVEEANMADPTKVTAPRTLAEEPARSSASKR